MGSIPFPPAHRELRHDTFQGMGDPHLAPLAGKRQTREAFYYLIPPCRSQKLASCLSCSSAAPWRRGGLTYPRAHPRAYPRPQPHLDHPATARNAPTQNLPQPWQRNLRPTPYPFLFFFFFLSLLLLPPLLHQPAPPPFALRLPHGLAARCLPPAQRPVRGGSEGQREAESHHFTSHPPAACAPAAEPRRGAGQRVGGRGGGTCCSPRPPLSPPRRSPARSCLSPKEKNRSLLHTPRLLQIV